MVYSPKRVVIYHYHYKSFRGSVDKRRTYFNVKSSGSKPARYNCSKPVRYNNFSSWQNLSKGYMPKTVRSVRRKNYFNNGQFFQLIGRLQVTYWIVSVLSSKKMYKNNKGWRHNNVLISVKKTRTQYKWCSAAIDFNLFITQVQKIGLRV